MFSVSVSIIPDGISTFISSHTAFITASCVSYLAFCSFCFFCLSFMLFFNSASVSNSLTSFANSSSNLGNSFFLISFTLTLKVASFPAKSFEKYSSGNFTLISFSSSIFIPITWSSNPGINVLLPISKSWFSAFPPSNATPSTNPSKLMLAMSPFSTGLSSTETNLELCSCICSNSCATSFSVTLYSILLISTPLYFPNSTSGFVWKTAVNFKSCPFPIWVTSISGLLTTSNLFSSTAFDNSSGTNSLKASS